MGKIQSIVLEATIDYFPAGVTSISLYLHYKHTPYLISPGSISTGTPCVTNYVITYIMVAPAFAAHWCDARCTQVEKAVPQGSHSIQSAMRSQFHNNSRRGTTGDKLRVLSS